MSTSCGSTSSAGASSASASRASSSVSAATTASGAPADGLVGADHRAHTRRRARRLDVEALDAGVGDRRAQDRRVQHARQLHVDRVARLPGHALGAVDARHRRADDRELGALAPRLELRVLVVVDGGDAELEALVDHPALAQALHAASRAARSTASSIFG
jgi:hypothetical protein